MRLSFLGCLLLFAGCNLHAPVGVVLVYEVDKERDPSAGKVPIDRVVAAVRRRLRLVGEAEADKDGRIEVRVYGNDPTAVRRRLDYAGVLEFRIVADLSDDRHREVIALAKSPQANPQETAPHAGVASDGNFVFDEGTAAAQWVKVSKTEIEHFANSPQFVTRLDAEGGIEVLVMIDPFNVTGEYFSSVSPGADRLGKPCIYFAFNSAGARRFGKLTGSNLPDYDANRFNHLAVILDRQLITAPALRSRIEERGEITGNYSDAEATELAAILGAGSLPAPLRLVDERPVAGAN